MIEVDSLADKRRDLLVEKMKMDKEFTLFLDAHDLDPEDTTSDDWVTYRSMIHTYDKISYDIRNIEYRIRREHQVV